jgi:hypothetical protein
MEQVLRRGLVRSIGTLQLSIGCPLLPSRSIPVGAVSVFYCCARSRRHRWRNMSSNSTFVLSQRNPDCHRAAFLRFRDSHQNETGQNREFRPRNERLWNDRRWREADVRQSRTPSRPRTRSGRVFAGVRFIAAASWLSTTAAAVRPGLFAGPAPTSTGVTIPNSANSPHTALVNARGSGEFLFSHLSIT